MKKSLIDVMAIVAELSERIANIESIMAHPAYDEMLDSEKKELRQQQSKLKGELANIMNIVAQSDATVEIDSVEAYRAKSDIPRQ